MLENKASNMEYTTLLKFVAAQPCFCFLHLPVAIYEQSVHNLFEEQHFPICADTIFSGKNTNNPMKLLIYTKNMCMLPTIKWKFL